jgi:hypothetical protein
MRFLKEIKKGAFIRDAENSLPADPLYCDFQIEAVPLSAL